MSKIKKTPVREAGKIPKTEIPDKELRFSFKYFDPSDAEMCPAVFQNGYTQTLMERLKALSGWKAKEFVTKPCKSMRNHKHDWSKTSRPKGFAHLPSFLQDYPGWQFQLTANEHGRVHGLLIDEVFYLVWLDKDHRLYP